MKTTFIRVLAIATLATSISGFAITSDSKPADPTANCVTSNQAATQNSKNSKKEKKARQDRKEQKEQKDQNTDQFSGIWG